MKKINIISIITLILFLNSCSDNFTDRNLGEFVSSDQLKDVAKVSPEALLTIANGLEAGNNFFFNDFNTANNGNIHDDYGQKSIDLGLDLMTNDMAMSINHWHGRYYNYTGRQVESRITDMVWKFYYKIIYNTNTNLALIPDNAPQDLQYIKARLRAMRGFAYFNLLRIYSNGDVTFPIYTSVQGETVLGRGTSTAVKAIIKSDFEYAYNNLAGYNRTNKLYINKQVAAGLFARYLLEFGTTTADFNQAASLAVEARNGFELVTGANLTITGAGWDGNSSITNTEWIWATDIDGATSTIYASFYSQISNLNAGYAGLLNAFKLGDKRLVDAIPSSDVRKDWFHNTSTPGYPITAASGQPIPLRGNLKFYDSTSGFQGDYVHMRAAEMYLIEAEAKFLAGNEPGAKSALTALVSTRDTSYDNSALSGNALRDHIRFQRSLELWGEGFSFFDMKRWNLPLARTYTGTNHPTFGRLDYPAGSTKFIFQIPQVEINNNINITANNPF